MKCSECGADWKQAALKCLMMDLGARVYPDPNECPETEDHEHVWVEDEE